MKKIVVDLTNPVWEQEGGFGPNSIYSNHRGPKCAIGKLNTCTLKSSRHHEIFTWFLNLFDSNGSDKFSEIWKLNDGHGKFKNSQEDHKAAVKLMLQYLIESGKVEFIGHPDNVLNPEFSNV